MATRKYFGIDSSKNETKELLKNKGVKEGKGYGQIYKFWFLDKTLRPIDKTLISYLASYQGIDTRVDSGIQDRVVYPSVRTITSDLQISQSTFYQARKRLVDAGYIKVLGPETKTQYQSRVEAAIKAGKDAANLYYRKSNAYVISGSIPAQKYDMALDQADEIEIKNKGLSISLDGVMPKMISKDKNLYSTCKAIYAAFALHENLETHECFCDRNEIIKTVGISEKTYSRHLKKLVDYGFINIVRNKDSRGRWTKPTYILVQYPDVDSALEIAIKKNEKRLSNKPTIPLIPNKTEEQSANKKRSVVEKFKRDYFGHEKNEQNIKAWQNFYRSHREYFETETDPIDEITEGNLEYANLIYEFVKYSEYTFTTADIADQYQLQKEKLWVKTIRYPFMYFANGLISSAKKREKINKYSNQIKAEQ